MESISSKLWTLLYDLDQAIDALREGYPHRELLILQRRQVRILIEIHAPAEAPERWRD